MIWPVKRHNTFEDNRGSFTPMTADLDGVKWDQFNVVTNNNAWVFRGMHYQTDPPQTKSIHVIKGEILDFVYDLETKEIQHFHLTPNEYLHVPDCKAHGYCTIVPNTIVAYFVKGAYSPDSEHTIPWHTLPEIKEHLPISRITTSDKDS